MLIVFDSINEVTFNTLNKPFTDYFLFFVNPILNFLIPIIIIIIFPTLTYRNIRLVNLIYNSRMKQFTFVS
jgi:hypothetical protein